MDFAVFKAILKFWNLRQLKSFVSEWPHQLWEGWIVESKEKEAKNHLKFIYNQIIHSLESICRKTQMHSPLMHLYD